MRITGQGGDVSSGPRPVAEIASWVLVRDSDVGPTFTATLAVCKVDVFRWAHADALRVSLSVGPRLWTWHVPALPAVSTSVAVQLIGPPIVT